MNTHERIIAVDFLRGFTVAGMILVNNPGSWSYIYPPLRHAEWNGCTPTDLVFPFFLFIAGISVSYAYLRAKNNLQKRKGIYLKILKRVFILFTLGLLLNGFPYYDFSDIRIPSVLGRIAIVFGCTSVIFLNTSQRTQLFIAAFLLIFYWIVMCFVPVPDSKELSLEAGKNFAAWFDRIFLTGHMWKWTMTWDPEGIFSTFPAIATGIIGCLAGQWLQSNNNIHLKLIQIFIYANLLIVAGLAWNMIFPINKSLWTSSYVLYTAGIALHALAMCYWCIDMLKIKKTSQLFLPFGSNAIAAYVLSELLTKILYTIPAGNGVMWETIFKTLSYFDLPLKLLSLVMALAYVALIYVPIRILYYKKIFIKV